MGGVTFGWIYIAMLRRGNDLSAPLNQFAGWVGRLFSRSDRSIPRHKSSKIFLRHSSVPASHRRGEISESTGRRRTAQSQRGAAGASPDERRKHQERLDTILDKIKDKGYDSLSEEEKEFLFIASKK
jgi:hypothetical protein